MCPVPFWTSPRRGVSSSAGRVRSAARHARFAERHALLLERPKRSGGIGVRDGAHCEFSLRNAQSRLSRALLGAAVILLVSGLSAVAHAKVRVCIISTTDDTGQGSSKELRKQLEASLAEDPELEVVPYGAYVKAAVDAGIPQNRWTEVPVLAQLAPQLRFDAALLVVLSRHGRKYRMIVFAIEPTTGKRVAKASTRLPRASLPDERAKEVTSQLKRELVENVKVAEPQPPDQPPDDVGEGTGDSPPDDSTGTDDWPEDGGDSGGEGEGGEGEGGEGQGGDDEWGDFDEEAFEEIVQDELVSSLKIETGGRVRVEHHSYFTDLGEDKINGRNSLDLALRAKASLKSVVTEGRFLVRYDYNDPTRNRVDAEEAYIQFGLGVLTLRAGKTMVSWGTANLRNPTDVLNPVDYRDPLEDEKLGLWMLRAKLVLGPVLLDGYCLPVHQPHMIPFYDRVGADGLPTSASRWVPDVDERDLPDERGVRYGFDEELPRLGPPRHLQGALRLAASVLEADLSIGYAYLFDRMPTVNVDVAPAPPSVDVTLRRSYDRIHAITADLERTFGGFRVAAEGLVVMTEDLDDREEQLENPFATVVLGVDYLTPDFFTDHKMQFFLDFTYTHMLVGELEGALADLRHPLPLALLSRVSYEWGQDFKIDLNFISALHRFDILVYPEVEYIVMDNVSVQLRGMFLFGDEDEGYFGPNRENSRVMANVEVRF